MKVISKQKNSRMCYICGLDNPQGLRCHFYNMEDDSVMTKFAYKDYHQSYPERVHGGLVATMLDELAFRAFWTGKENEDIFGATMSMEVKFRKPVPYNIDLYGKGIIIEDLSRFFVSEVKIFDDTETVLANAKVKYIKAPIEKLLDSDGNTTFHDVMFLSPDNVTKI